LALERVRQLPSDTWADEPRPEGARRKVETTWQMAKQKAWRDPSGRLIEGDAYSLGMTGDRYETLLGNYRNAWAGLLMI
jgi:hypothetical protein